MKRGCGVLSCMVKRRMLKNERRSPSALNVRGVRKRESCMAKDKICGMGNEVTSGTMCERAVVRTKGRGIRRKRERTDRDPQRATFALHHQAVNKHGGESFHSNILD